MARRPNILLLMTDQHRADHLGCYGNPIVRTPNLDALAARGRRFTRMHVAIPVCTPNRISMLTGRMPSVHGARFNGIPMALDQIGFVELLRVAGWRTGLIGTSHLQNFLGRPPAIAFETEPGLAPPPPALREASRTLRAGDAYRAEEDGALACRPGLSRPHALLRVRPCGARHRSRRSLRRRRRGVAPRPGPGPGRAPRPRQRHPRSALLGAAGMADAPAGTPLPHRLDRRARRSLPRRGARGGALLP